MFKKLLIMMLFVFFSSIVFADTSFFDNPDEFILYTSFSNITNMTTNTTTTTIEIPSGGGGSYTPPVINYTVIPIDEEPHPRIIDRVVDGLKLKSVQIVLLGLGAIGLFLLIIRWNRP